MKNYIGLKIKELRSRQSTNLGTKITQQMLADKIGVSRSYLGDIESGRTQPNEELLLKLSMALDVSINEFKIPTERPIDKINKLVSENKIKNIAAHFDGENFTDEDVEDIENFIKYVVAKRKNKL